MGSIIRGLLTRMCGSYTEFVQTIRQEGGGPIVIEPYVVAWNVHETETVGMMADFQYMLRFSCVTRRGRKALYRQWVFERFGSELGTADAEERYRMAIRLFLRAERTATNLRESFPDAKVCIRGAEGLEISEEIRERVKKEAGVRGISDD